MKDKILYSFIYFLAMLLLVPPLFVKGAPFDVSAECLDECGNLSVQSGIFFDNVFVTILTLGMAWLAGTIPFLLTKSKPMIQNICYMFSAWFLSGLVYEIANFSTPTIVLNDSSDRVLFNRFLLMFIIGLTLISLQKKMDQIQTIITFLSIVFGGLISLLIYIWNQTQKANDKRHEESERRNAILHEKHEKMTEELIKNSIEQKMILAELNTMVKYHEKKLEQL